MFASLLFLAAAHPTMSMIPVSAALEPPAALTAFEVADGLKVELVAAEPLVFSPVAMAFDARRRLFVVEMPGFPLGNPPGQTPADRIVLLEDTDGDGRLDKRTVYADGLAFPMGVLPWKDGVIVTCAPDILLLRDTDGDGRADQRRVLFTGFSTKSSPALRINCPTLGPDGWIYIASGHSGGSILTPDHPGRPALEMTADVRFHPETLEIENVDGRTQYGMSFDAAGRRFTCNNRVPVQHVVLGAKWLRRNPNLAFSATVEDCSERTLRNVFRNSGSGQGVRLFPISSHLVNVDAHAGSFTAACAVLVWGDGALSEPFRDAVFSCDPTANLVHVDRLVPRGPTFAAEPILEGREFLASRDDWFRPVFLARGPDDALYVADMYRKIIEHVEYLPEEIRKYADVRAGHDRGRIWRVVAKSKAEPSAPTRPIVAEHVWLGTPPPTEPAAARRWLEERLAAAKSSDARTRLLAALVLGDVPDPRATAALAAVAARDLDDRWMRAGVLSGVAGREAEILRELGSRLERAGDAELEFASVLGRGFATREALQAAVSRLEAVPVDLAPKEASPVSAALWLGFAERTGLRFDREERNSWFASLLQTARATAVDTARSAAQRIYAVRLLGRMAWPEVSAVLLRLARDEPGETLRLAAIKSLAGFEEPAVGRTLLSPKHWSAATPSVRAGILGAMLPSEFHRQGLLEAIEAGHLPASAISGVPRRQFLTHRDPSIRRRAQRLWEEAPADRQRAFEKSKAALALTGRSALGRELFQNLCASCHRLDQTGHNVGPDLADMRRQAKETILYHIVVPEAEIAPMFVTYVAETRDGRTVSGIMGGESSHAITLLGPLAQETRLLRSEISRLESLPVSLMPAGYESAMSSQDLADLLAYLRGEK